MEDNALVLELRPIEQRDAELITRAFAAVGQVKPERQYLDYVAEREAEIRYSWLALRGGAVAGYVTLHFNPLYPGIAGKGIPEVQDLYVVPAERRRGVGSALLECAEQGAAARARRVAIAVGLHAGYNAAQRLYVRRGYVPDGLGVTYDDRYVQRGETLPVDDQLLLHLIKALP